MFKSVNFISARFAGLSTLFFVMSFLAVVFTTVRILFKPTFPFFNHLLQGDILLKIPGSAFLNIEFTLTNSPYYDISGLLISVLTTYLYFIIAIYYVPVKNNIIMFKLFIFFMILSEISLYLTFLTSNFFIFYSLFEFILIPFYFIVLLWGSRANRVGASFRLVFFTLVFSLPLTTIVAFNLYNNYFSFNFSMLFSTLSANSIVLQFFFYISCFMAFAVKIPLFPAHVWLPEAHGEAPTFGSVLLAGILLKLGGYGFYQVFYEFSNSLYNMQIVSFFSLIYVISLLTIFYSNIIVFNQLDIKKTIAYYSIGHMGFVTLGLICGNKEAIMGAVLIMLSHGLSAAGLFFCVGYIYEQSHTRSIIAFRGLATIAPYLGTIFFLFICANISFPGTSNFIGEQIVLIGLAKISPEFTYLPIAGVLFNGLSSFLFFGRIIFGESRENTVIIKEIDKWAFFLLLAIFTPLVIIGFYPQIIFDLLL
jgi:NADH-quinone oxidoreductase subunit M